MLFPRWIKLICGMEEEFHLQVEGCLSPEIQLLYPSPPPRVELPHVLVQCAYSEGPLLPNLITSQSAQEISTKMS